MRSAEPLGLPAPPTATPGSYAGRAGTYPSLLAFVRADPRRGPSPEVDLGLYWRDAHDHVFRAAWVRDTGELTLIQVGPPDQGGGHVEVLGTITTEARVSDALTGWRDVYGEPGSVDWLRARASGQQ